MASKKERSRSAKDVQSASVSRRDALKAASTIALGAVAGSLGFPAIVRSAEDKKFRKPIVVAFGAKEGEPNYMSIGEIGRILREKYDVEVDLQIHPAYTLGTGQSQMEGVQTGFIDITNNSSSNFEPYTDAWSFLDLPYMIGSWEMAQRFYDSDLFKARAARMESTMPVKTLPSCGAGGYRVLWNRVRPLRAPDDVKGLKLRTTPSPVAVDLVRSWGGNPTPIPWSEVYTAMQQGVVDGLHLQPVWAHSSNITEVLKYGTRDKGLFAVEIQVMNINTWNAMPEAIQKPFMMAAREAAILASEKDRELEGHYLQKARDAGIEIYEPSAQEFAKWKEKGTSIWSNHEIDPSVIKSMQDLA